MVLTKDELIAGLQKEVRIFVHLIGKVDPAKIDYRPSAKQRSVLELVQYMTVMAPAMTESIKAGEFTREAMGAIWGPRDEASKKMNWEQAVAAIGRQSDEMTQYIGGVDRRGFSQRHQYVWAGHDARRGAGEHGAVRLRGVPDAAVFVLEGDGQGRVEHDESVGRR